MISHPPGSGKPRRLLKIVVPVAIVGIGVAAFAALRLSKETPQRVERVSIGPLVETVDCPVGKVTVSVEAQGTVRPATEIDLVPQVSGIVVWKAALLESGGYFQRGDLLAQIDPRDYEFAAEAADAALARAEFNLEISRGEARVARAEWERIGSAHTAVQPGEAADSTQVNPLVLHVPQLKASEAAHQAARARCGEAQLRLERTKLHAPFDGRVRSTDLDRGQYVTAGRPIAKIYSIERAEVVVPVPDEELAWVDLPQPPGGFLAAGGLVSTGDQEKRARVPASSGVAVSGFYGGRQHRWLGRLVRAEGEFDRQSRMVNLVVEVADPYESSAPLTAGMFVDVVVGGPQVTGVRTLPRAALRGGDRVWTAGPQGRLRVRDVTVVRKQGKEVLAIFDMAAEEGVIVSPLQGVTDGMKVRVDYGDTKR